MDQLTRHFGPSRNVIADRDDHVHEEQTYASPPRSTAGGYERLVSSLAGAYLILDTTSVNRIRASPRP
jgi:hypothetical protein